MFVITILRYFFQELTCNEIILSNLKIKKLQKAKLSSEILLQFMIVPSV